MPEISKAIFTGLVYLQTHLHTSMHSFIHILLGLYVLRRLFVYLYSALNILFSCSTDVCAQLEEVKCDWFLKQRQRSELTTDVGQIFQRGQKGQQCFQSLILLKQSFTFNQPGPCDDNVPI